MFSVRFSQSSSIIIVTFNANRPFPGSGKSLIYQLAALEMNKLAVIVGPLLSLSDDQVEKLTGKGIPARLLNHRVSLSSLKD